MCAYICVCVYVCVCVYIYTHTQCIQWSQVKILMGRSMIAPQPPPPPPPPPPVLSPNSILLLHSFRYTFVPSRKNAARISEMLFFSSILLV